MKFFAVILSFYILLLTMQPTLSAIDLSCKEECRSVCSTQNCEKQAPQKQQENNSTGRKCNPFQSCVLCCCCIVAERQIDVVALPTARAFTPPVYEGFISGFISDCFHPPENV